MSMPVAHHEYILYPEARKVPRYDTVSNALAHPDKYTPDCAYLHHHFQKEARRVLAPSVVTMGSAYSVFRDGKNNFPEIEREVCSCTLCNICVELLIRQENTGCVVHEKEYGEILRRTRKQYLYRCPPF
jgi:hypothetical protein